MSLDIHSLLADYFPPAVLEQLQMVGQTAMLMGYEAYLIGGNVRDLLLQRSFDQDVDVVVTPPPGPPPAPPAIRLAQHLHHRWGGQLQTFPQYGTACLLLAEVRMDFAMARTETYAHPGANPEVELTDLNADLARRDFSVNALAMALSPDKWGELIDHYGGLEDLHHRHLRVLHPDKFLEDPVRSWRACRFETTLGHFQLEPQSEQWLQQAMQTGLFDGFISARIKKELVSILTLTDPRPVLRRLFQTGTIRCLSPALHLTPDYEHALAHWMVYRSIFPNSSGDWLVPLLLLEVPPPVFEKLQINRQEQHLLRDWQVLQQTWPNVTLERPSSLYQWGHNRYPQAILAFMAALPEMSQQEQLHHYWTEIRPLKPRLSGKILKEWQVPGPAIGTILHQVLMARLDGQLTTEQDEYEWARHLAESMSKQSPL